jgi:hypothetical protein
MSSTRHTPKTSLVIPAWNEAACLPPLRFPRNRRLQRARTAGGRIGIPPAVVLNSTRKFDKHGDWHMIFDLLRGAFYLLFARHRLKQYARRYWYEGR